MLAQATSSVINIFLTPTFVGVTISNAFVRGSRGFNKDFLWHISCKICKCITVVLSGWRDEYKEGYDKRVDQMKPDIMGTALRIQRSVLLKTAESVKKYLLQEDTYGNQY
jgi:hypothetical protein